MRRAYVGPLQSSRGVRAAAQPGERSGRRCDAATPDRFGAKMPTRRPTPFTARLGGFILAAVVLVACATPSVDPTGQPSPTSTVGTTVPASTSTRPDTTSNPDPGDTPTTEIPTTITVPRVSFDPVEVAACDTPEECGHPLAASSAWQIPVVSLSFLSDGDGDGVVDEAETGWAGSVSDLRERVARLNNAGAWWGTEASRYRRADGTRTDPSVSFEIVHQVEFEGLVPAGLEVPWKPGEGWFRPDYRGILSDLDVCSWVDGAGVREVWMWTQHHGGIEPTESNMSGPHGDISNSERSDDLPRCAHTYTVYNFNFTRSVAEMLHNRGHQAEALFSRADPQLWASFVGPSDRPGGNPVQGCGDTHFPPNAESAYDYVNLRQVATDCTAWQPDRQGPTEQISCETWFSYAYGAPDCFNDGGLAFYVWWLQGLPGRDHQLSLEGDPLINWWLLFADLDAAVTGGPSWLVG